MSEPLGCLVRTRLWRNGTLEKEDFPITELSDHLDEPDCVVWADILRPDAHTLGVLGTELALDDHAIEDAVSEHERPKAMRYRTHTFLTTYALRLEGAELATSRISAFAIKRGFITVRLDDAFDMDAVVRVWEDNADLMKYGPRALAYGLMDVVVDGYFDCIGSLDDQIEDLEDALFEERPSTANGVQRQTFQLRKALTRSRRAVLPMREVVATLMHRTVDGEGAVPELAPYYEDLYDHVLRASEWTESLRDMVSSVFETTLSLSDVRMNTIMKKLTSWAAIIAVPTAVTGFFGQNVPYPGFGHWSGFVASCAIMIVIALVLYITFRAKDWL
ncbi:MAG: magnesium transporter CorA family protein [Jatrophihabitans sp.]|uniref:magnesium transporter CorA family protein n=1 Tax=Jatrophihabitans sp. TaxID=1932789 RepID=UPI003F7EB427